MKTSDDIIIIGDVHRDFGILNAFINKHRPKMIISCGDFGYWPRIKEKSKGNRPPKPLTVKTGDTKVYFCDGNHEDHWSLNQLENNEVYPNVFYMKRGSVLTLHDGRNCLFMGGAQSIDRDMRLEGFDWFPEEEISWKDMENLPDPNTKIDIVISHTCPSDIISQIGGYNTTVEDWSRKALSHIRQLYLPDLWYFGHFHMFKTFYALNCRWTVLNMTRASDWWIKLHNA